MSDRDELFRAVGKLEGNVESLQEDMKEVKVQVGEIHTIVNGGGNGEVVKRTPSEWTKDNAPMLTAVGAIAVLVAGIVKGLEMAGVI